MSAVLVTGGAGFIGTHIICALAAQGRRCISIDNYSNSSPRSIDRVLQLAANSVQAFDVDIRDSEAISRVLAAHDVDSVIHLAGLKAVGESVEFPERYYDNNVRGTESLLKALARSDARNFVFSSSCTVYGSPKTLPITEAAPTDPQSPYGQNKLAIEQMLSSLAKADRSWRVANLRYFNPVGAHESGLIGEDPAGVPNNLMPYVCQVASGRYKEVRVWGKDYPTVDGTGVRDYIHVVDLAEGHVAALQMLERTTGGVTTLNLGTGRGYSVLEVLDTFERVNGIKIPRAILDRRPGDVAAAYADVSLAGKTLGWSAKRGIADMCRDAWRWQKMNPQGYAPA